MSLMEELDKITESNNVVNRFANSTRYSGYTGGLSNISNRIDDNERAKLDAADAERKAKADAQLETKCLQAAQKAIETGTIESYNRGRWSKYFLTKDFCPAVDPETRELVYDPARKGAIYTKARADYFKRQHEYNVNYAAMRKAAEVTEEDS